MSKALETARVLLAERLTFPVASPDWDWRTKAAWKLEQLHRRIPPRDWTDTPPQGLEWLGAADHQHWETAA